MDFINEFQSQAFQLVKKRELFKKRYEFFQSSNESKMQKNTTNALQVYAYLNYQAFKESRVAERQIANLFSSLLLKEPLIEAN